MSLYDYREAQPLSLISYTFFPLQPTSYLFPLSLVKDVKSNLKKKCCTIYRPNGIHLATRKQEGNLFHLSMFNHAFVITGPLRALLIKLWHQRLEHLRLENVQKLQNNSTGICLDQTNVPTVCKPCLAGK